MERQPCQEIQAHREGRGGGWRAHHILRAAQANTQSTRRGALQSQSLVGLVRDQRSVARDLQAASDELAEPVSGERQHLLRGEARVEDAEMDVVGDKLDGETPRQSLLLRVHERVMRDERGDGLGAIRERGAAELPTGRGTQGVSSGMRA